MKINITTSAMTGARVPREAELQPDWCSSDAANTGDLQAPCWVPTGGTHAMDWPAIQGAPALRIVYGEQFRERAV